MPIPSVARLADLTIELLARRSAPLPSAEMRDVLAKDVPLARDGKDWPHFVNNHA